MLFQKLKILIDPIQKIINFKKLLYESLILILFLIFVIFLRFSSFAYSTIDWDESHYMIIAKEFLNGHLPLTYIWNQKPVGIYFLFAAAMMIFGKSVIAIRLLACISIACTSYLLYKTGSVINSKIAGILAGVSYAIFTLKNGGLASNTELFFIPFAVLAFYLLFANYNCLEKISFNSYKKFFLIGLVFGLASLIKYVVLFDIIAFTIITLIISLLYFKNDIRVIYFKLIILFLCLSAGILIPHLLIFILYAVAGQLNILAYTFLSNFKYVTGNPFSYKIFLESLTYSLYVPYYGLLISILPIIFIYKDLSYRVKLNIAFVLIWLCLVFNGIIYGLTRYYCHYFIQLLPALCLLSGISLYNFFKSCNCFKKLKWINNAAKLIVFFILIQFLLLPIFIQGSLFTKTLAESRSNYKKHGKVVYDIPVQISDYLNKRIKPDQYIFVIDHYISVYFLTKAKTPSPYIFPLFLIMKEYEKFLDINQVAELDKIMAKKPAYVVLDLNMYTRWNPTFYNFEFIKKLTTYLQNDYIIDTKFGDHTVYRLKSIK